ncbi:MAG: hypothetical protein ACR2LZ_08665 [Pyrinomonadaceae bacterium]
MAKAFRRDWRTDQFPPGAGANRRFNGAKVFMTFIRVSPLTAPAQGSIARESQLRRGR